MTAIRILAAVTAGILSTVLMVASIQAETPYWIALANCALIASIVLGPDAVRDSGEKRPPIL
jgi:hypothetical protein